jgi:hypothetical protein
VQHRIIGIASTLLLACALTGCTDVTDAGTPDEARAGADETGSVDMMDELAAPEAQAQTTNGQIACGGIAGIQCPDGMTCFIPPGQNYPDAMGTCHGNPNGNGNGGGSDNGNGNGNGTPGCNYGANDKTWVSKDADQCALILFLCQEGEQPFFNECGCGCEPVVELCGDKVCGSDEFCCNPSCGICAPDGGFCTQQYCG